MDLVEISSIDPHDLNIYLGDCNEETGNVILDEIRVDLFCSSSNTSDQNSDDFLLNDLQDGSLFATDFNSDDNYLEKLCLERADILQGRTSSCDSMEEKLEKKEKFLPRVEKSMEFNETPSFSRLLDENLVDNNFSNRAKTFSNDKAAQNNNSNSVKNKNLFFKSDGKSQRDEYETGPLKDINRIIDTRICDSFDDFESIDDRLIDVDQNFEKDFKQSTPVIDDKVGGASFDRLLYKVVGKNENANILVAVSKRNGLNFSNRPVSNPMLKEHLPFKNLIGCEITTKIQSLKVTENVQEKKLSLLREECKYVSSSEDLFLMKRFKKKNNDNFDAERVSLNTKNFRCSSCSKEFNEETALILHETIHSTQKRYSTFYNCSVCDKNFTKETEYIEHLTTHKDRKSIICEVCGKRFKFRRDLNRHATTHNGDKPFTCLICEKRFSQKKSLQLHSLTHTGEKQYKCLICSKSFSLKWNLEAHKLTHVDTKPFSCELCLESFKHKQHLNDHRQAIHEKDKLYSCTKCDRQFTHKQTLLKHSKKHDSCKPFTCDVCHKQFKSKSEIAVHCRLHTGERPFACNECGRRFRFQHSLKNHSLLHTNRRPFRCSLCPKSFVQKSVLDRHQTVHTKEKRYSCSHCHKKYSHRHNLTRHKIVHKHV